MDYYTSKMEDVQIALNNLDKAKIVSLAKALVKHISTEDYIRLRESLDNITGVRVRKSDVLTGTDYRLKTVVVEFSDGRGKAEISDISGDNNHFDYLVSQNVVYEIDRFI